VRGKPCQDCGRAAAVVETVGDTALAIRWPGSRGMPSDREWTWLRTLAARLGAEWPCGLVDVVLSPDRVTLVYDPLAGRLATLVAEVRRIAADIDVRAAGEPVQGVPVIEIPVRYGGEEGPDLEEVCAACGIDRATFIRLHTGAEYRVAAMGFVPGFGYLSGLPRPLAVPRRATPRPRVAAGSVGIGGAQTGVYPLATPGGWQIVGRTDAVLFDPRREPAATLHLGDRVRFVESQGDRDREAAAPKAARNHLPTLPVAGIDDTVHEEAAGWLTILSPGLHCTVQDLGRPGLRGEGVPLGGAVDPLSLRLANLAVGNPENTAAIECTLLGPTIRFDSAATVAVLGAAFPGLPEGRPFRLAAGAVLTLGHAERGCRGVLAIAGGIGVEPVLGSRATDVQAGLGGLRGLPLAAGDRLPILPPARAVGIGRWRIDPRLCPLPGSDTILRVVPAAGDRWPVAWQTAWRASARSDRMGLRLDGPPLDSAAAGRGAGDGAGGSAGEAPGEDALSVSVAVLPGTVQVPPDGKPILLLADAQSIGGYPILGQVIAADLPLAARLRPGEAVRLAPVTVAEAHASLAAWERAIGVVRRGIEPRLTRLPSIDLNCDVGEGAGHDDSLVPLVSSVNIACGWHAGEPATLRRTVAIARWHGVAVGAHPGHADREGFGRRERPITPKAAADLVAEQVAVIARIAGESLRHVKLHGGLYHQVGRDESMARAVAGRLARDWPDLILMAASGSRLARVAKEIGLAVAEEAFLDRGYDDSGELLPRSAAGGLIAEPHAAATQARSIACTGRVATASGGSIPLRADTLCVHGDGPNPLACLLAARRTLAAEGIAIAPPNRG